ncbi:MAG TPA: hypothetical protein DCQ50_16950 [Chryseobacterium sp.]|nr:hypothetical protein [Chryseobacterium sp.]
MKKYLIGIVFCPVVLISGQELSFIPSSPQSFQFTREKSVSEDEHTGKLNINIPLLSLNGNKISTALSLQYFGAGVKVDDLPNDTGMTWMINAGGIISRTVNGLPDENTDRLTKNYNEITQNAASDCAADDILRKVCYQPTAIDSERDVFNVKVHNISASFYLDENFNPYFMKNDSDVKIKTINADPNLGNRSFTGFEMTDANGIRYIFGGSLDYREMTGSKMMPAPGGISNYADTSYFLKEIIHPNNEKISFTYQNSDFETHTVFENDICYLFSGNNLDPSNNPVSVLSPEIKKSFQTLYVLNKKRISQITSTESNRMIKFNYDTKINSEFKTYLSSIELKENNTEKEKILFNYVFDGAKNNNRSQRFFLTSVQLYKNNVFEKKYNFSYNDPLELPKRISYEQDMYGYYNNKTLNQSLIASFHNYMLPLSPAYTPAVLNSFGERTPDFFYASKGLLTEVNYPTGGKTTIEYEAPPMRDLQQVNGGVNLLFNNNVMESDRLYGEWIIENIYQPQTVNINYSMGSDNYNGNHTQQFSWKLIDLDTGQTLLTGGRILGYSSQIQTQIFQFLPNKRYKLIAQAGANNPPISVNSYVMANVALSYTQLSDNSVDGYGIRVKSIKDTDQGVVKSYKRLYYNPAEIYDHQNLPVLKTIPQISTVSIGDHHAAGPAITYALHSSNNTSDMYNSSLQERYEFVTTSVGGDHFENGGYEKMFRKDYNEPNQVLTIDPGPGYWSSSVSTGLNYSAFIQNVITSTFFSAKSNRLTFSGNILRTRDFVKVGNNIFRNRQTNYSYNYQILKAQPNLIVFKMYDESTLALCSYGDVQRISNYHLGLYNHYTIDAKLRKEEVVEYIDYMPLETSLSAPSYDDYLNPNYRKLITTKNYDYSSMHSQVTKQTLTTPENSITETNYQYAHEKNNQLMISKNMIGIPLETTVTQTVGGVTKTLGKTETVYPASLPTPQAGNLVLPLSQKSYDKLSGTSSTDVTYDRYDEKGNILQYTTKDGIPVAIVWGYNKTQPIAKVEGITYDQLTSTVPVSGIVTASDNDAADPAQESLLLDALNSFRKQSALSGKLISTYTYDPLIGVTSITPPSGVRQTYTYDPANRLKETGVRGKNSAGSYINKKMSENKYNYKP